MGWAQEWQHGRCTSCMLPIVTLPRTQALQQLAASSAQERAGVEGASVTALASNPVTMAQPAGPARVCAAEGCGATLGLHEPLCCTYPAAAGRPAALWRCTARPRCGSLNPWAQARADLHSITFNVAASVLLCSALLYRCDCAPPGVAAMGATAGSSTGGSTQTENPG